MSCIREQVPEASTPNCLPNAVMKPIHSHPINMSRCRAGREGSSAHLETAPTPSHSFHIVSLIALHFVMSAPIAGDVRDHVRMRITRRLLVTEHPSPRRSGCATLDHTMRRVREQDVLLSVRLSWVSVARHRPGAPTASAARYHLIRLAKCQGQTNDRLQNPPCRRSPASWHWIGSDWLVRVVPGRRQDTRSTERATRCE
jgi:hypothetical protein